MAMGRSAMERKPVGNWPACLDLPSLLRSMFPSSWYLPLHLETSPEGSLTSAWDSLYWELQPTVSKGLSS